MRTTCNHGVHVVLNPLAGELLEATWDCIASFGRFVEIGKSDIHAHAKLPMFPFSFIGVDLNHMYDEGPQAWHDSLLAVVDLVACLKRMNIPFPLSVYPIS